MKSKISFFNRGIIFDDLKRVSWIGIAYMIILFFMVPLQIIMKVNSTEVFKEDVLKSTITCLFQFKEGQAESVLVILVPVFIAIFLFRYIQTKASADMIHSLPIKRNVLYRSHVAVGLLLLILPVILNGCFLWILKGTANLGKYYSLQDIAAWIGTMILFSLLFYFAAIFFGMIAGLSTAQGILTYIFLFFPVGFSLLLEYNLKFWIYGFRMNEYGRDDISPLLRILEGFGESREKLGMREILIYLGICAILYFVARYAYNKRKLEVATQAIAFHRLQYVFKYGFTFCVMLLAGAYFEEVQHRASWVLFGYLIGSILGYFVAEMIIRKSIKVFTHIKGYGIYAAIMIILFVGVKLDVIGYEQRTPELSNVESIYFSGNFYNTKYEKYKTDLYSDPKNIDSIAAFHREIIREKNQNKFIENVHRRDVVFVYHLKNGGTLQRGYTISDVDYEKRYRKYLKPVEESMEYKRNKYDLLSLNSEDASKMKIMSYGGDRGNVKGVSILKPQEIKEALEILKQEVGKVSYEDIESRRADWGRIEFYIPEDKIKNYPKLEELKRNGREEGIIDLSWNKSYVTFEKWLKEKGYLENARILPEDISYAIVEKVENPQTFRQKAKNGAPIDQDNKANVKRMEIRDKNQLEGCLRAYHEGWGTEHVKYAIGFYNEKKENMIYGIFEEQDIPDFIEQYFK